MFLLLDDSLLSCVPVSENLQDRWLYVVEASKISLPGSESSVSTEMCDGLYHVVLAVMASGLLMSEDGLQILGYVGSQPFEI